MYPYFVMGDPFPLGAPFQEIKENDLAYILSHGLEAFFTSRTDPTEIVCEEPLKQRSPPLNHLEDDGAMVMVIEQIHQYSLRYL